MNNVVDKVYLALELTKTRIQFGAPNAFDSEHTLSTFQYFVEELTGIEFLGQVAELQEENERLKEQIKKLNKRKKGISSEECDRLRAILDANKGDMEPRVFEMLISCINMYLQ